MGRFDLAAANRGLAFALAVSGAVVAHGQAPAPGYGYAPAPSPAPVAQPQGYAAAGPSYGYPPAATGVTYSAVTPYVAAEPYPTPAYVAEQPAPTSYPAPGCETSAPCTDYCAPAMCCPPTPRWTISGGALLFFQDNENHHTFSYDSAVETTQLLDWSEQEADFLPGFEVGLTRFDCCTMTGWEGLYWGLFPGDSSAEVYDTSVTGNLDPILDFSQLDYNGGPASASTNDARVHRLTRSSEFHNAELNRLWGVPGGNSAWNVRTLAGFRYFRFEEDLEFAADTIDTTFTGAPNELYYTVDTENNLYGLQFGGAVERQTWGRLNLTAGAKAGVYYNDASAHSRIGGAAGTATVNNGPNVGRTWDVTAEKEDVAFLAEISAGMNYQIGERWRAIAEYRVVGVSGVALPANQIYPDLRGLQDVELLNTNGSLLLHGVFVGAERVF